MSNTPVSDLLADLRTAVRRKMELEHRVHVLLAENEQLRRKLVDNERLAEIRLNQVDRAGWLEARR